ncbi:MAG: crotonase/enoyl-CoA hydratase family protein [Gordonia polyisoprenivorans]|nr:crotonase/enoyl-CoA hydratase family protein [Gordonia polyisoprenivorans]
MADNDDQVVLYEVDDNHCALIRLNRPDARNAVNPAVAEGVERALDAAENDDSVWAVIITGAGETFCAGADLKTIASGDFGGIETSRGGFAGIVKRRRSKPVIAAVNGPALAGGCEIALACDLIVASNTASFGLPEVKRSLVAIAGGLIRLPQTLPRNLAMEIALTGEPISAARAAQFGLVNHLCERDEVLEVARRLAQAITANAPLAVQATRQVLLDSMTASPDEVWKIGWRAVKPLFATDDFAEGPRAFVEKRAPRWTGR